MSHWNVLLEEYFSEWGSHFYNESQCWVELFAIDVRCVFKSIISACESMDRTLTLLSQQSKLNPSVWLWPPWVFETGDCLIFTPQHRLGSDASGLLRLICCCNPLSACCPRSRAAVPHNSGLKNSGRCVCRVQTQSTTQVGEKNTQVVCWPSATERLMIGSQQRPIVMSKS